MIKKKTWLRHKYNSFIRFGLFLYVIIFGFLGIKFLEWWVKKE